MRAAPNERSLHLADLFVLALAIVESVGAPFFPAGPFDGQIVSTATHVGLSVAGASLACLALSLAVRQRRPRWFWPVMLAALCFAFHGLIRVVNSKDGSIPQAHLTRVTAWKTTWASWRGSGKWARRVTVESWSSPGGRVEFRVPEGSVTRPSGFAQAQLARFPRASMDSLMFPEAAPCEVWTGPGALGLEHVVGLHLLLEP